MEITVNGRARAVEEGTTVAALLETLEVSPRATAVEVNRELVPRSRHAARTLAEGDAVEIVTLVGGG
jgi:sulfur carrier protein